MAEIPDDIRKKARATADDIRQRFPHDHAEIIARAILAERERCAERVTSMLDVTGRIVAAGWRGNPNMSGDDRDFMGPMQRARHDQRVSEALSYIAAAIRKGE